MNYRYHSTRCRHGMCLETVGCDTCGVKVKEAAGAHLRRADTRSRGGLGEGADGYGMTESRGRGNSNARRAG